MSTPPELASLQGEDTLRFAVDCAGLGMGIVRVIDQTLVVDFFSPGIVGFRLALPAHSGFLIGLVAFECPLARPGIADALDVLALLGRLRWLECGSRRAFHGDDRQDQARPVASEFE